MKHVPLHCVEICSRRMPLCFHRRVPPSIGLMSLSAAFAQVPKPSTRCPRESRRSVPHGAGECSLTYIYPLLPTDLRRFIFFCTLPKARLSWNLPVSCAWCTVEEHPFLPLQITAVTFRHASAHIARCGLILSDTEHLGVPVLQSISNFIR